MNKPVREKDSENKEQQNVEKQRKKCLGKMNLWVRQKGS